MWTGARQMIKRSKYGNKKTYINGITFDSKKEAERYVYLKSLEASGGIRDVELQPKFLLQEKYKSEGKWIQPITYFADFRYILNDREIVEDVKSEATAKSEVYRLKKKMLLFKYPNLNFREV
jgi:hypothetical protein